MLQPASELMQLLLLFLIRFTMYKLHHKKSAHFQLVPTFGTFNVNLKATCTLLRLTLLNVSSSSQPFVPKATWKQVFGQITCFSSNLFKQAQPLPGTPKSLNYCVKVADRITRQLKKKNGASKMESVLDPGKWYFNKMVTRNRLSLP